MTEGVPGLVESREAFAKAAVKLTHDPAGRRRVVAEVAQLLLDVLDSVEQSEEEMSLMVAYDVLREAARGLEPPLEVP